jgi:hypothetical protein
MLITKHYEKDCRRFLVIPKPLIETYPVRRAIAQLRNDGPYWSFNGGSPILLTAVMCR